MQARLRVVAALWFFLIANYLDRVAISFAGPSIMKSLGMSPAHFGLVLSSFSLGYCLALIPGGMFADHWSTRSVLIIGPLIWAALTGATGAVAGLTGFLVVRALFGAAEGMCNPAAQAAIGESFGPRERARALAIYSSAGPLGSAFAGTLVGFLVRWYGWRAMFPIMAIPAVIAAALAFFLLPARRSRRAAMPHDERSFSIAQLLSEPSIWLLSLAAFCWNIPYQGFLGWMPSYLALQRHIDLKTLGPLSSIPYVFGFFGMLAGGFLGSGKLHRYCVQIVIGSFLLASLFLFLAYQAPTVPLTLVGLSGAGVCVFGSIGPIGKIALDLAPTHARASFIAVYSVSGQLGAIASPAAIGFMVSRTGAFGMGFGFMIAAFLASSLCLLALLRSTRATERAYATAFR